MAVAALAQTPKFTRETPISKSEVPDVVLKAFESAYPKAKARGYAKVEVDCRPFYKIESVDGITHRNISYNTDGGVTKTEERIAVADLPAEAKQVIQEQYPKAEVTSSEKVTQGDQVEYKVSVRKDGKLFDLQFDVNGKLMSAHEVKVNIVIR